MSAEIVTPPPVLNVDTDVVRAELERVRNTNGGDLKPVDVVAAARSEESPLHAMFEWDDSVAAESFRVAQARRLIQIVLVRAAPLVDGPRTVRVYLSPPEYRAQGRGYVPVEEVKANSNWRAQMLRQAIVDIERAATSRQYQAFDELDALRREVANLCERWRYKLDVA